MISSNLGITTDSIPPMELFEKSLINPQNWTPEQQQQITSFAVILTTLQDYASADDTIAVNYVSKFYSYFCTHYDGYSSLPKEAKLSFQAAYFSDPESFMNKAYNTSSCVDNYFDL